MKTVIKFIFAVVFILPVFAVSCDSSHCNHPNIEIRNFDADCENGGKTEYACPDCGLRYIDNVSNPAGHVFVKETVAPDCNNIGYTVYTCECGYSYTSDYTSALGHDYKTSEKSPTCLEIGKVTFTCSLCGYEYEDITSNPLGHQYNEEIVTLQSCTEVGEIRYTCQACGDSYSDYTYPEGHKFTHSVMMPTLSDIGYTRYTCEACAFTYDGDLRFYSSIVPNAYAGGSKILASGIDISVYNHKGASDGSFLPLDWKAIAEEGIDYVILKAGSSLRDGGTQGGIDITFEMDYADAKAAGLGVGAYFYTYATNVEEIINDAYVLLGILDGKQFEYPIYLDLEDDSIRGLGADTLNEMCIEFFTILQRAGYYTGLYVNHEWLYNVIKTDVALSKFEIWYARYPEVDDPSWNEASYGATLGMWQYTDKGSLTVLGDLPVDRSYSFKDYPTIIKEGGFNGYETNVLFPDNIKTFVWIKANALTVRSDNNFESSDNILAYVTYGSRLEVLEISLEYTKILYDGKEAYISANNEYISWTPIIYAK